MPLSGIGAKGALAVLKETTPGTPGSVGSALFLTFTTESMVSDRDYMNDESIIADRMLQSVVPGIQKVAGNVTQNFDGVTVGQMLFFANGPAGYSHAAYNDYAMAAPAGTPNTGTGTLPAGTYYYKVAPVWQRVSNLRNLIMPSSPSSSAVTLSAVGNNALAFTGGSPTDTDYTLNGRIIYRGATSGQEKFLTYVPTASTYTDNGSVTPDLTVSPYAASLIQHYMDGTPAAVGVEPIPSFTTFVSKDTADNSEEYLMCRVNTAKVAASSGSAIMTAEYGLVGQQEVDIPTFEPSQQLIDPFQGWQAVLFFNGTKDCNVMSFEFTLSNGIEPDEGLCGVDYNQGNISGARGVEGQFTRQFTNHQYHTYMMNGTTFSLEITSFGQSVVKSGCSTLLVPHGITAVPWQYAVKFNFPNCVAKKAGGNIGGKGKIVETVGFTAAKDFATGTDMAITLINVTPDYSA